MAKPKKRKITKSAPQSPQSRLPKRPQAKKKPKAAKAVISEKKSGNAIRTPKSRKRK